MKSLIDPRDTNIATLPEDANTPNTNNDPVDNSSATAIDEGQNPDKVDVYLTVTPGNVENSDNVFDAQESLDCSYVFMRQDARDEQNANTTRTESAISSPSMVNLEVNTDQAQNNTLATFIAETKFRDENLIDLLVEDGQRLKPKAQQLTAAALVFAGSGSIINKDGLLQLKEIWASHQKIATDAYENIFAVASEDQTLLIVGSINGMADCTILMLGNVE